MNPIANKVQLSLMAFFAIMIPVMGLFAPLSISSIFVITAIYPTYLFIRQGNFKTIWGDSNLNKLIIIFLAYSLLSSLWAIKPEQSVHLWIRMVLFFVGSLALFAYIKQMDSKEKLLKAMLYGIVITIIITNIELFTGGIIIKTIRLYTDEYLTKNRTLRPPMANYIVELNRGASILSILSWVGICYLCTKHQLKTAILLYVTVLLTIIRMESLSTVLGMFIGGIFVFPIVFFKGKKSLQAFTILAALGVFAVAGGAAMLDANKIVGKFPVIPGGASDIRLYIYDYTAEQAMKKPILGWGFNSSRSYPVLESDFVQGGRSPLPLHPHNNTLQVWLELGIVGLIMFASFLALILIRISENNYPPYIMASCAALFANYFLIGQTAYGVCQNWWVASGILATALIMLAIRAQQENNS